MISDNEILGVFELMGVGMVTVFAALDSVYLTPDMSVLDLYIAILIIGAVIDFIDGFIRGRYD